MGSLHLFYPDINTTVREAPLQHVNSVLSWGSNLLVHGSDSPARIARPPLQLGGSCLLGIGLGNHRWHRLLQSCPAWVHSANDS